MVINTTATSLNPAFSIRLITSSLLLITFDTILTRLFKKVKFLALIITTGLHLSRIIQLATGLF